MDGWEHCSDISKTFPEYIAWIWSRKKKECFLYPTIKKRRRWEDNVSGLQQCGNGTQRIQRDI